jgi:hypothetical protein
MVQNLKQYLKEHKCKGFNPVPHYFPNGDFVSYFFRNDRCRAQRVDDLLTVYLAIETDELVGCKIKGVRHILETAGNFGVALDDGDLRLGLFFFVGAATAKDEDQKRRYDELGRIAKDATVDRRELQPA